MEAIERFYKRKEEVKEKMKRIIIPNENATYFFVQLGAALGCSGVTIKNYIYGQVKDGFFAETIIEHCKKIKAYK